MWLGVCFGTIIIGILLLIFAPGILFFPFNFFLVLGLSVMNPLKYNKSYKFKYNQNNYTKPFQNDLDKHYKILESSKEDSFDTIKANYRRLIKEYHYDTIASKNLPEQMVKFAKERTQALNEAYAIIKETRNTK